MNRQTWQMIERLKSAGISEDDAFALRRIALTLDRWHELECGIGDNATYCVERETDNEESAPHMWRHDHNGSHDLGRIPDREKGAKKRLAKIMERYPDRTAYIQGDPRGASLYIVSNADVPPGEDVSTFYTRGIAVFK